MELNKSLDVTKFSSLGELYAKRMEQHKDIPMMNNFGAGVSYDELSKTANALAYYFQQELKLRKNDRIGLMMPNVMQYPALIIGAHLAGLVVVNINPLYTATELKHQLNDSDTNVIVLLETSMQALIDCLDETAVKTVIVTKVGDMIPGVKGAIINFVLKYVKKMVPKYSLPGLVFLKEVIKRNMGKSPKTVQVTRDDLAFFQYTGGTTGLAKGVMLSHGNILSNLEQFTQASVEKFSDLDLTSEKRVCLAALPIYHIFALMLFLATLNCGQSMLLITNPRDIPNMIKELIKNPVNTMALLNTLMIHMMGHKDFLKIDWEKSDFIITGGMATQKAVADRWQELTGCVVQQGYGLSETSPIVTVSDFKSDEKFVNSIGKPLMNTEVKVINVETLEELAPGEPGELCVKGPQVMQGYLNNEEATAEVMLEDGWFRTGDIVTLAEDGSITIVDRLKDMIIVSGFNVYPNEVEGVLAQHDKIAECGVIGVPDDETGEMVKAFIVSADESLTEAAVIEHCHQHLAHYKTPHKIAFVNEIPKTPVGKVLRRELRKVA